MLEFALILFLLVVELGVKRLGEFPGKCEGLGVLQNLFCGLGIFPERFENIRYFLNKHIFR